MEEHDAWFREQVRIGLDSANAGKLISYEETEARFAARRAVTRRRLDKLPVKLNWAAAGEASVLTPCGPNAVPTDRRLRQKLGWTRPSKSLT